MPTGTVRIKNNTTYTPTLENIALANCNWLYTQELHDGDPIANNGLKQGTVDIAGMAFADYRIDLHVRFYGPPPGTHDVILQMGRDDNGQMAFVGTGANSTDLFDVDWAHVLGGPTDDIFVITISPK